MNEITEKEAKSLVDELGPRLGPGGDSFCDFTHSPWFPETRKDVCAVRRTAENGHSYGFDTVYLLWKNEKGLQHEKLTDSEDTKNYLNIEGIVEESEDIIVKVRDCGGYRKSTGNHEYRRSKKDLGI